jgi:hypothetical protein
MMNAAGAFQWTFTTAPEQVRKGRSIKKVYPFLNDTNVQDFLFARAMIIEAPYAAKATDNPMRLWEAFHAKLVVIRDIHGNYPFAAMTIAEAKSRVIEYLALAPHWSVDASNRFRGVDYGFKDNADGCYDDDNVDDGNAYARKIYGFVENIVDECLEHDYTIEL